MTSNPPNPAMLHSIQNAATFQDAWERLVRTSMMRLIGPLFGDYADGEARSFVMNEGFHATYEWHDGAYRQVES